MHYLRPVILFTLSSSVVTGQRLAKPAEYFHTSSLSWMSNYERVHPSSTSLEHEAAQKRAALQAALGRKEIIVDIKLPRLNGGDLAAIYRACTGRRVIISAAAATAEFSLAVRASPQHSITNAQLAEHIKKSAAVEGFAFSPDDGDLNLDVLTQAAGTRIICPGVQCFNENTPLPEGDSVISYVMTLKYLEPNEVIGIFAKHVDESDPYSSITSVSNAHSIVATYRTSIIRKLIALKNDVDKP
ncbi:MAG: hypothetical protein ABIT37_03690 [Luteolibacter sp.]